MESQEATTKRKRGERGPRVNFPRQTADVSHGACASPFFTVEQFSRRNPAFTVPILRWQIFNAANNGLAESGAVIRLGRAVYIDEPLYFKWVRPKASAA